MMLVNTKLELAVKLVQEYFTEYATASVSFDNWFSNEVVKVEIVCKKCEEQQILKLAAFETIKDKQCMISIYSGDEILSQSLFQYADDMQVVDAIKLPLDFEEYKDRYSSKINEVLEGIGVKLNLKNYVNKLREDSAQDQNERAHPHDMHNNPLERYPQRVERTSNRDDIPKFEDEYEINSRRTDPNCLEPPGGYGDRDLYPTGQKYPNLNNPNVMPHLPNNQGGMVFDPFGDRNHVRNPRDMPPGWIPGAKFDDPYGRPPSGFPGGPSSGPGGFDSGGFGSNGFI